MIHILTNCCNTSSSPISQSPVSPSVSDCLTLLPPTSLVSVCLWLCTSKSCYCLPLLAAYICLLSVETKETDHKAYYGASSGVHAVYVCAHGGWTHKHTHTHTNPLPLSSSSFPSYDASHMVSRQVAK